MLRRMLVFLLIALTVAIFVSCKDQEKQVLKASLMESASAMLDLSVTLCSTRDSLQIERYNRFVCGNTIDSLIATLNNQKTESAILRDMLIDNHAKMVELEKTVRDQKRSELLLLFDQKHLSDSLSIDLEKSMYLNTSLADVLSAKDAQLDSIRQCYQVQKHNAGRPYLKKVFAADKWRLPFDEPALLLDPRALSVHDYELRQNVPNPFIGSTMISFALPIAGDYALTIYSVTGEKVDEFKGAMCGGNISLPWHPRDLSSGIYFYTLEAGDFKQTRKMVLLK